MNKFEDLKLVSNPSIVFKNALKMGYTIGMSSRKNKKYMVQTPTKWVHFGDMRYEDFTKHHDEDRRMRFLKRNWKWASYDKYTPAYLSFMLLW